LVRSKACRDNRVILAVAIAKLISKQREGNWSDMAHSPKKAILRSTNFAD
jgi:hypothetical protein